MSTVFITGSASGIGKEAAALFSEKVWSVFATVHKEGHGNYSAVCDVTDKQGVENAVAKCLSEHGQIDLLINNAGIYSTYPLEHMDDEDIFRIIQTNIMGIINVTRAVLPHMRKNKHGTIINVSSVAGMTAFPYQSVYHASKWAVEGFSESLQYELANHNIRVKTRLYEKIQAEADIPEGYESFSASHKFLINNIKKGYSPEITADTIYKAATDNRNKLRYISGNDTKMALMLRKILPFGIFTSLIRKISGA